MGRQICGSSATSEGPQLKVLVTGATGFVGRHAVERLIKAGHEVIATARNPKKASLMPWFNQVEFIECDLAVDFQILLNMAKKIDVVIHLAWSGLPNYTDYSHIDKNFILSLDFLHKIIISGVPRIVVAGSCLEYGLQEGALQESTNTYPITEYGFAKDALRKSLQFLKNKYSFDLKWVRLFYVYGEGQSSGSLLSQLDLAIESGDEVFNMSPGDQIRDFVPIEYAAEVICMSAESSALQGIINCCSGNPKSVLDFVKERCAKKSSSITLNLCFYDYPRYEPYKFWGVSENLNIK